MKALANLAIGMSAMTLGATPGATQATQAAPTPALEYAFSAEVTLAPPVEQGQIDGARKRFIPITGGTVSGPMLTGTVLAGGGDWQSIMPGGLTRIEARYFLKASDGTVIAVTNPGVRVASSEVTDQLAKGIPVDPSAYYFRTTPRFEAPEGPHAWLNRAVFVARAIRQPDHVTIDVYVVR